MPALQSWGFSDEACALFFAASNCPCVCECVCWGGGGGGGLGSRATLCSSLLHLSQLSVCVCGWAFFYSLNRKPLSLNPRRETMKQRKVVEIGK
jgi:hypothetical protein